MIHSFTWLCLLKTEGQLLFFFTVFLNIKSWIADLRINQGEKRVLFIVPEVKREIFSFYQNGESIITCWEPWCRFWLWAWFYCSYQKYKKEKFLLCQRLPVSLSQSSTEADVCLYLQWHRLLQCPVFPFFLKEHLKSKTEETKTSRMEHNTPVLKSLH